MRSILLLEPARTTAGNYRRPPLGLATVHAYLRSRGIDSEYRDPLAGLSPAEITELGEPGPGRQRGIARLVAALGPTLARYDFVGLSVTYRESLELVCELAKEVRARHPGKPVVAGGRQMTRMYFNDDLSVRLFTDSFDYVIVYDGEAALAELLARHGSGSIAGIPNLLYLADGRVVQPEIRNDLPLDELPLVFTSDARFAEYENARGCYWRRCRFCQYTSESCNFPYRERSAAAIGEHLEQILAQAPGRTIFFTTDAMSVRQAKAISRQILDRGLELSWLVFLRFERGLTRSVLEQMKASGCAGLYFGLESGDERVNCEIVNKGIDLDEAQRVLRDCHAVGIRTTVNVVTGLPTETLAEATHTFRFLWRNREQITACVLHFFQMVGTADYALNPEAYGIVETSWDERHHAIDFVARRGRIYRRYLMKPNAAGWYAFLRLFTDIQLRVPRENRVVTVLTNRLFEPLVALTKTPAARRLTGRATGGAHP